MVKQIIVNGRLCQKNTNCRMTQSHANLLCALELTDHRNPQVRDQPATGRKGLFHYFPLKCFFVTSNVFVEIKVTNRNYFRDDSIKRIGLVRVIAISIIHVAYFHGKLWVLRSFNITHHGFTWNICYFIFMNCNKSCIN
jgi:hypothetical protein